MDDPEQQRTTLRPGTPVLIKAKVDRQTTVGNHGIDSVVVWVDNPLSTTRSTREVNLTVAPEQVVMPGEEATALVLIGRLLRASNADLLLHAEPRNETDDPDVAGHLVITYTGTSLAPASVDLNAAELALLQHLAPTDG